MNDGNMSRRARTSFCKSLKKSTNLSCSRRRVPSFPKKYSTRPPSSTEPETFIPVLIPSLCEAPCLFRLRMSVITFLNSALSMPLHKFQQPTQHKVLRFYFIFPLISYWYETYPSLSRSNILNATEKLDSGMLNIVTKKMYLLHYKVNLRYS